MGDGRLTCGAECIRLCVGDVFRLFVSWLSVWKGGGDESVLRLVTLWVVMCSLSAINVTGEESKLSDWKGNLFSSNTTCLETYTLPFGARHLKPLCL